MITLIFFYAIMDSEGIKSASLVMERKIEEVSISRVIFDFVAHKIFPAVVDI